MLIFAFFWFKEVKLGNSDEPTSKDKSVLQHQSRQESIMITSLEGDVTIPCEEITYINAAGNYMEIVTSSKTYLLRKTLKQLEQTLPLNSFFRCHRSYIVNLNAINKIQNLDAGHGEIHLKSGNTIPVSKSQRTGLKQAFATLTS